jgi:hypothetical protein
LGIPIVQRLKKTLKWTAIVLGGLVAIGLVANAVFVWTTDLRLERQWAEIRAAGDPLTLADLAHPLIPAEKNAATYLRRAEADAAAIEKQIEGSDISKDLSAGEFPPSPRVQKALKSALDAHPKVAMLLEQAAACPDYDVQLDYTVSAEEFTETQLMPLQSKVRTFARVLRYRARLLTAEGNRDEAVRTAVTVFRLARHFDRNSMVVGYLVAIVVRMYAIQSANEALQTGPVSQPVGEALEAELAIQERMDGYSGMIGGERAFGLEMTKTLPNRNWWLIQRGI